MGIRLEITTDVAITAQGGPSQRAQIDDALNALGFLRESNLSLGGVLASAAIAGEHLAAKQAAEQQAAAEKAPFRSIEEMQVELGETDPEVVKLAEGNKRKRRTKAEIDAEKAAEAPQITTQPENRVDPETAAQDQADEAAETEAAKPAELTHNDVRNALGAYVKKFGMDAAQADGPALLKVIFGEACKKVTDIPADQASLGKAVAGAREMLEKNPYKRTEV